ncbi:MAG: hypothetical protein ACRBBP_11655 [Bdellovibrionales bacterium]
MKKVLLISLLGATFTLEAVAVTPITVSCYRGPWEEVIVDRPNPIFIDTLMLNGYSIATATAIATRVCTDQELVGNLGAMKAETIKLLRAVPKDGLN